MIDNPQTSPPEAASASGEVSGTAAEESSYV
jgi:hypothetical protein